MEAVAVISLLDRSGSTFFEPAESRPHSRLFDYSRTMATAIELSHPTRDALELSAVLFALSDPDRLEIARQLRDGPMDAAVCHAVDPAMPKSTKSHLMKVLREAGVIRNEPNGRFRELSLRRDDLDARFPGLIDAVLGAAPSRDPE
jgi:DNA-binding transcriptional ArsR family regulator